jgi:hypothetical protein
MRYTNYLARSPTRRVWAFFTAPTRSGPSLGGGSKAVGYVFAPNSRVAFLTHVFDSSFCQSAGEMCRTVPTFRRSLRQRQGRERVFRLVCVEFVGTGLLRRCGFNSSVTTKEGGVLPPSLDERVRVHDAIIVLGLR